MEVRNHAATTCHRTTTARFRSAMALRVQNPASYGTDIGRFIVSNMTPDDVAGQINVVVQIQNDLPPCHLHAQIPRVRQTHQIRLYVSDARADRCQIRTDVRGMFRILVNYYHFERRIRLPQNLLEGSAQEYGAFVRWNNDRNELHIENSLILIKQVQRDC